MARSVARAVAGNSAIVGAMLKALVVCSFMCKQKLQGSWVDDSKAVMPLVRKQPGISMCFE